MNILTPQGYKDILDCKIGDEVVYYDDITGVEKRNIIEEIEIKNKDFQEIVRYKRTKHGKKGDKPIYEPVHFYSINGQGCWYGNQSIWKGKNVTHIKLLKIGDVIYDGKGLPLIVHTLDVVPDGVFYKLKISGDHSFIADGLTLHNASRYWVSGTGTWDASSTTHWGSASGVADNSSVPSSSDNVIGDTLSNATAYTITYGANVSCADITIGLPLTSGVATLFCGGNFQLSIYGSVSFDNGTITQASPAGGFTFKATSTGKLITTNSSSNQIYMTTIFNGTGGEWTLQDDWNGVHNLTLTAGSLITNGKTVTCGTLSISGSTTRAINATSSTLNCTVFSAATMNSITTTWTSSIVKMTGTGTFSGGVVGTTQTYNEIQLNGTSHTVNGTFNCLVFTRNGTSTFTDSVTFQTSGSVTVTSTINLLGNSLTNRLYVSSNTRGTTATINCTGATKNFSNVDFEDIAITSGSAGTISSVGDCGGNTNISADTPTTIYWKHGATASTTISIIANLYTATNGGGSANQVPLPQHTIKFDLNSFSASGKTVSIDMPRVGTLDWTGCTNTPTLGTTAFTTYGGFIGGTMTVTANSGNYITFMGRGNNTFTAAATMSRPINIDCLSGKITLGHDYSYGTSEFLHPSGTIDFAGYNITVNDYYSSGSGSRTLIANTGSPVLELKSTSATWQMSSATGVTLTIPNLTIYLSDAGSTTKTFSIPSGLTFHNIQFAGNSTGIYYINNNVTFDDIKFLASPAKLQGLHGTTINTTTFTRPADSGVITIQSDTTSAWTFNKNGGGTIAVDYISVSYNTGTPASTWDGGTHGTDGGHNTGWTFTGGGSPFIPKFVMIN